MMPPSSHDESHNTFSSSSYSLNSNFTSSTGITASTSSSRSTVPGIGALSGKVILALGKVTLRGAEHVIIRRRLGVIDANFPPADRKNVKGIEQMYDDLLELSRLNMYPKAIRNRATQILLVQIGIRQTQHLIKCLKKWPDVEIQIFMSELFGILDPIRLFHAEVTADVKIKAYWSTLAAWESHSLVPFVDFCDQLAQSLNKSSVTFLRAGVLTFLLHAYATNFHDPLAENERESIHRTSAFQVACNLLLKDLCDTKDGLATIHSHPLHSLWPMRPALPFTTDIRDRIGERMTAWNAIPDEVVLWRLQSTLDVMLDRTRVFDESVMYDFCIDLLEFSGSRNMDRKIAIHALRTLQRVYSQHNRVARAAISQCFTSSATEHCTQIVSQIVRRLARIIPRDTPEFRLFVLSSDDEDVLLFTVPRFLDLFLNIAKADDRFLAVVVAADILGLMRPLLEQEFQGHASIHMAPHDGDLSMVYDPPDFALLALIKEHGLKPLLPNPPGQQKENLAFYYRRKVLCGAFSVFLGRGDSLSRPVPWNPDWDEPESGFKGNNGSSVD